MLKIFRIIMFVCLAGMLIGCGENVTSPFDKDGDGIVNAIDNCPEIANPEQQDINGNGIGNVCDTDADSDADTDSDADADSDADTDSDTDADSDADSDSAEDTDNDGVVNNLDNCINISNPDQLDTDNDGIGDVCDDTIDNSSSVSVPGRIEAEDYISFYDTTNGNTGGVYRSDDVDIEATTDTDGGYNIGWTAAGEYLRYRIDTDEAGEFKLTARVATLKSNCSIQFKLNGGNIGEELQVPNTGGWQIWADITTTVSLSSGSHELEIFFNTNEINLNYIDVNSVESDQTWELVWQDEFNSNSIDGSKWEHEVNATGGGNNELQYYTARAENSYVENGSLFIEARKEQYTDSEGTRDYTSARLRTLNKGDFLYGKIEVKAKLPAGQGLWPAIWMLPTDWVYGGWAASGEIDILEAVNLQAGGGNQVHGTLHYGGQWPNNTHSGDSYTPAESVVDNFHTYTIEWEPEEIRWYVDGVHYQTQNNWYSEAGGYPAPFNQRFHIILNVAVGGNWPGSPDDSSSFPQTMEVDYVRVYSKTASADIPEKILFVGNSYTFYNDMPEIVEAMAADQGIELDITMSTKSSAWWDDHLDNDGVSTATLIATGNYDYVVMQNNSLSALQPDRFHSTGTELIDLIETGGATALLYETWARKDYGSIQQSQITPVYNKLANDKGVELVPVGEVWQDLRNNNGTAGDSLFHADGSHPSPVGSYFIASVFYRAFTGNQTINIPASVGGVTIDQATADIIHNMVDSYNLNINLNLQ